MEIKRNKLSSHKIHRETLKYILLSEKYQSKKSIYYTIPNMWHYEKGKTTEKVKISVISMGLMAKERIVEHRIFLFFSETILYDTVMVHNTAMVHIWH